MLPPGHGPPWSRETTDAANERSWKSQSGKERLGGGVSLRETRVAGGGSPASVAFLSVGIGGDVGSMSRTVNGVSLAVCYSEGRQGILRNLRNQ